jgi:exopolysaccharide biosynthesis WecB/TagA/CpsF family protein
MLQGAEAARAATQKIIVGGMPISVLDRPAAARLMLDSAREHPRGRRPLYFTSANGEVLARCASNPALNALFAGSDQILADGQPLVMASRLFCRQPLPERVATTDLFHDAARMAQARGDTFYLFGATEAENAKAFEVIQAAYPALKIIGRSHGYLSGLELDRKLAEINELAPDVLWLGLGVPREQMFVRDHVAKLSNVGLIKTSGGLFDHLSGKNKRAPRTLQKLGLEWFWRLLLEPKRLFWRYVSTNPQALYVMVTRSS